MSWLGGSSQPHGNTKRGDKKGRNCILSLELGVDRKAAWSGLPRRFQCSCYIAGPKPQLWEHRPPCLFLMAPPMPLTKPRGFPSFPSTPSWPQPSPDLAFLPLLCHHLAFAAARLPHLWLPAPPRLQTQNTGHRMKQQQLREGSAVWLNSVSSSYRHAFFHFKRAFI